MEQATALLDRIRALKAVASSMHEGTIDTELIPEIDKILALPEDLGASKVGELEAVARQVREYEQTFDRLGYTLLDQLMPTTGESPVFQVVRAQEGFRARLQGRIGQRFQIGGKEILLDAHAYEVLTRYSLSIGTPPVTAGMRDLVARVLLGQRVAELPHYIETLGHEPVELGRLFRFLEELVDMSLHYCTASEERAFLREAAEFINFEGGRLFNRVLITESPDRVIALISRHVFDKFGGGDTPVRLVDGLDRLDADLIARMHAEPNHVFVARVTRIPHRLFVPEHGQSPWQSVIGRLILIDCSARARRSNTTVVYTLFPHVARTLRNIQTSFAGRPANTQLQLRRILESFSVPALASIEGALTRRLGQLAAEGALGGTVDELRQREWRKGAFFEYLTLAKLRRLLVFLRGVAESSDSERLARGAALRQQVGADWMRYLYGGLSGCPFTVLPGGGRGALTLVGKYHRHRVQELAAVFQRDHLAACRERLQAYKAETAIPAASTDEIQAAIRHSRLRALSPTQWHGKEEQAGLGPHLARTLLYRVADTAAGLSQRTQHGLSRAAFGNLTGGAAAFLKGRASRAGLSALHGRLERVVGAELGQRGRTLRDALVPAQEAVRGVQRQIAAFKGGLDPVAVADIEAVLNVVEQGHFYPALILPAMAWTYGDVFPEKDFPQSCALTVPLNDQHEMDPLWLRAKLDELRYLFRRFPEIFTLLCQSMLLVINSPHNPTGVVYRRETLLGLLQIAAEFDLTVVDDNAYHKVISKAHKDREGDDCVAQIYEKHRGHFTRPVRLLTVGATTKGLQGSGDRTGLLFANVPEAVAFAEGQASEPHLLSLYLTQLKLESGLAAKGVTEELERLAVEMLDPTAMVPPWERVHALLTAQLGHAAEEGFPVVVFATLLEGYEELLRLRQRGATVRHLSEALSMLCGQIKNLRLERRMRADVEARLAQVRGALGRAVPDNRYIDPQGAFYTCVQLCDPADPSGMMDFVRALSASRKVDVVYVGHGQVRLSLGGMLKGDAQSYEQLGQALTVYLRVLHRSWQAFCAAGRDPAALPGIFTPPGQDPIAAALAELSPLLDAHGPAGPGRRGTPIDPSEKGLVYCIEEGRSEADKIFVETAGCETVDELLQSQAFRVLYRRLLRKIYRGNLQLAELTFEQVESQYGPLSCRRAYRDRQLIDEVFRQVLKALYTEWHGQNTSKVLASTLQGGRHAETVAALHGVNRTLNGLLNELMCAFEIPSEHVTAESTFDIGYQVLTAVAAHPSLPDYVRRIVPCCPFAGATAALNAMPVYVTGATKRVEDYNYGFIRRDREGGETAPTLAYFRGRFALFQELAQLGDYVCKAVQVGPFKMLLVIHKSCFHLINDELRLFPQIEAVQLRQNLDGLCWDGVLLYGIPAKVMGDCYKTGYVLDTTADGAPLPTAWVAREDATDYVGFLKKSLLTLHNERVKALGGMPVHGAMITIIFKNGLRKTLVFSADSGTGKSETITAMMEQIISGKNEVASIRRIDTLAGDMLSLWRGEDRQIYAFGTETGDFMRLTDITDGWKRRFGDLLRKGSYSNLWFKKNPRVTIPDICDRKKVLTPTRVNGFFYINNYDAVTGSSVELCEDPHHVLKTLLVRGLRKNKGTSGDQPALRAGLEFAGKLALVVRYRHLLDELLHWRAATVAGQARTCLVFRDGAGDVHKAREIVGQAFRGTTFERDGQRLRVLSVDHDIMTNLFWLICERRQRVLLDREVYDQIYEPLVSTFCGNPFIDPEGMDRILGLYAETMRVAKVHTGVIRTQLAREGFEHAGPAQAARHIVQFLLGDEEVNARFQHNKHKVHVAMQETYGGVLEAGSNLPVELEGYNLLLLEEHESTHVAFCDQDDRTFTLSTPYYRYEQPRRESERKAFRPAIALPEILATITDVCGNRNYHQDLSGLAVELRRYERIRSWNSIEELTYQVLMVNGIINIGSSERELGRFPGEVCKARHVAEHLAAQRHGGGAP